MRQERIKAILEQSRENWEELAGDFSQTRRYLWPELDDFQRYVKEGDKVLDLGCGNGRLYELFGQEIDYLGVDQSSKLITLARERFPAAKFAVADALNLPLKEKFDVIFSIAFFHHIPSRQLRLKVLRNCRDLLKTDGLMICTVWNLFQPCLIWKYNIAKILLGFRDVFIPFQIRQRKIKRYYHAFGEKELKRTFQRSGFEIVKCYYTRKDRLVGRLNGYNLVLIAKRND